MHLFLFQLLFFSSLYFAFYSCSLDYVALLCICLVCFWFCFALLCSPLNFCCIALHFSALHGLLRFDLNCLVVIALGLLFIALLCFTLTCFTFRCFAFIALLDIELLRCASGRKESSNLSIFYQTRFVAHGVLWKRT